MNCLFCGNPLDGSDEHIIPASLNGRIHSKEIICYDCNSNVFGEKVDPVGKEFFDYLLLALNFKNAKGRHFKDLDGEAYLMNKDGEIKQVRPKVIRKKIGDREIIAVEGSRKDAIQQYQKIAKDLTAQGKKQVKHEQLEIEKNIGPLIGETGGHKVSPELILLLNKIALEFCVLKTDIEIDTIKPLATRVHALDKTIDNVSFCNLDEEVRAFVDDEITHLIKVFSYNGKAYAYVELFNVICSALLLVDEYDGDDIEAQYYQNALTGERIESEILVDKAAIEALFDSNKQEYSKINFEPLINRMFRSKTGQDVSQKLQKDIQNLGKELNEQLESGLISEDEFRKQVIERGAMLIAEASINSPYLFDEIDDENDYKVHYIHSNVKYEDYQEFCSINSHLVGLELVFGNDHKYQISGFEKIPVTEKNGVKIVRVYVLVDSVNGMVRIPYREMFEFLERVHNKQQKRKTGSKKKHFSSRSKKKLRKGKGLRIANKRRRRRSLKKRKRNNS